MMQNIETFDYVIDIHNIANIFFVASILYIYKECKISITS